MAVDAQLVKLLREKTGAGMLDCKKAIEETGGDIDKAVDYLREKGIAKAAKKADRIAAEGLTSYEISGNKAVIFEINSETDFVAKNQEFLTLLDTVGQILIKGNASDLESALTLPSNEGTLADLVVSATSRIGERINLRRVAFLTKDSSQVFGAYKHMGGRISSLALLNGGNEDVAKDIAMHVAAQNPLYLDESQISESFIAHEREVLRTEALNEGKPEAIVDKMVEGRLNKTLKELSLVHQPFVKNPDQTISEFVKAAGASVVNFVRLEVGEGIEKNQGDFAEEVKAQMQG
jgi:elongation factor Ts